MEGRCSPEAVQRQYSCIGEGIRNRLLSFWNEDISTSSAKTLRGWSGLYLWQDGAYKSTTTAPTERVQRPAHLDLWENGVSKCESNCSQRKHGAESYACWCSADVVSDVASVYRVACPPGPFPIRKSQYEASLEGLSCRHVWEAGFGVWWRASVQFDKHFVETDGRICHFNLTGQTNI